MQPQSDRLGFYNAAADAKLQLLKKEMFRSENMQIPKSYVDQIPQLVAKEDKFNYQTRE